ncbi:MAG: chemotaxis protein CheD [Parvularculaceae bacterium]|nr:chemotaxis protein CheD [Parvularculaceae bacterium]
MTFAAQSAAPRRRPPTLIGIGGLAWSGDPGVVYSTLLGSCIAFCLYDPVAGKGGLNHFLLAHAPQGEDCDTRYGTIALPPLVNNLCAVGCDRSRLEAVVAGGSDILSNIHPIGTENAKFALEWVKEQGIKLVHQDVGGRDPRRVRFLPTTGEYRIQHVETAPSAPVG